MSLELTREKTGLTRVLNPETRALVSTTLQTVLAGSGVRHVGVSTKWLIKAVEMLDLSEPELELFLSIRTEFNGSLPKTLMLMQRSGITAEEAYYCYQIVAELKREKNRGGAPSIKRLAQLIHTFAEAEADNENLAELIEDVHRIISRKFFWVQYFDQSIRILCEVADTTGCASIDAALSQIDSISYHQDFGGGIEELDETDRHRADYERRNPHIQSR